MLNYHQSDLLLSDSEFIDEIGDVTWRSPSNIAIIKYWGKYGTQLPRNPSMSFTLSSAFTDMKLSYERRESDEEKGGILLDFAFHGEKKPAFKAKIEKYLESLLPIFPFLEQIKLEINTGNSFPHSAGIASSASAMSALALCLCSMEDDLFGSLKDPLAFDKKASFLARLGSGSACRSIFGQAAVWGKHSAVLGSADEYAISIEESLHPIFKTLHDDILLVSSAEKSVSSRSGHALMETHSEAQARYDTAHKNLERLLPALRDGDLASFGKIAEAEALQIHALMNSGENPYNLLLPGSYAIIDAVRQFRADTGLPLYFTIDAGPNIHLLYPEEYIMEVRGFIADELAQHCENGMLLEDWVGEGPEEL